MIETLRNGVTAETTVVNDDEVLIRDTSATTGKRITVRNFMKVITELATETAPDILDELALYDVSAATSDKITLANLLKVVNGLTADTAPAKAADYLLSYDASAAAAKKVLVQDIPLPPAHISGLGYSNNAADATNDIDIAAGSARDATDTVNLILGSALTKQSDVAWAVGTNAGGLDAGAVGNSDYYIWLIKRSDTGVVDVLFSLSPTAPTMPTSYDYGRLIGWFKRVGGSIVAFHTYETCGGGIELLWDSPTLDISLANTLTTAKRTDAVKVPLIFSTVAHLNVTVGDAGNPVVYICCPDLTDLAPSLTVAPLATLRAEATGSTWQGVRDIRTSAAGLIAARSDTATVDNYRVVTLGFVWGRR
jgi:hypothetical protein